MRRLRSQAGFTSVELVLVLAIIGVMVAIAVPNLTRYRDQEQAKEVAHRVAAALRLARSSAMKDGVPYFVLFNPAGLAPPAPNPQPDPNALARVVRDANGDSLETAGEIIVEIAPRNLGTPQVTPYRNPGPYPGGGLINTDAAGGTLAGIVNGANFPIDPNTGLPAVGFTVRGWAVPINDTANLGAGAGSYYITDGRSIYAASVGPLGDVRVRAYSAALDDWR